MMIGEHHINEHNLCNNLISDIEKSEPEYEFSHCTETDLACNSQNSS